MLLEILTALRKQPVNMFEFAEENLSTKMGDILIKTTCKHV